MYFCRHKFHFALALPTLHHTVEGFEFMMEKEKILDGRQEERFYGREEKKKFQEHSDIVFDKGIKCWSVCALSFLLMFLTEGQVNSFGAAMVVS